MHYEAVTIWQDDTGKFVIRVTTNETRQIITLSELQFTQLLCTLAMNFPDKYDHIREVVGRPPKAVRYEPETEKPDY